MGRIKITKMKDGEDDLQLGFRMNVVGLSDIDPSQTSLALEPMEDDELAGIKASPNVKLNDDAIMALQALRQAIAEGGVTPPLGLDRAPRGTKAVSKELWNEYFKQISLKEGGTMRTAMSRAVSQLKKARKFDKWGNWYWLTQEKEPEPIQAPAQKVQPLETYDDIPFP